MKVEGPKTFHIVTGFLPAEGVVSKVPKPDGRIGIDSEVGLSGSFAKRKIFAEIPVSVLIFPYPPHRIEPEALADCPVRNRLAPQAQRVNLDFVCSSVLCFGVACSTESDRAVIEVRIDQQIARSGNHDAKTQEASNRFVPCPDAFIALRLDRIDAKRLGLTEWFTVINQPVKPTKHPLEIRDGDYFPKTLLIRAKDAVVDPEYGKWKRPLESINGMTFHKMFRSSPPGSPMEAYQILAVEPYAIEIRNGTYPDRRSYLFVVGDSCAALTNVEGAVSFAELPCDVDLPKQIQFPWHSWEKTVFDSPTLKLNDKGRFKLRVTSGAENRHVIKILPRPVPVE